MTTYFIFFSMYNVVTMCRIKDYKNKDHLVEWHRELLTPMQKYSHASNAAQLAEEEGTNSQDQLVSCNRKTVLATLFISLHSSAVKCLLLEAFHVKNEGMYSGFMEHGQHHHKR